MGRFDVQLLDNDRLFQTLMRDITPSEAEVAGELDVGSFENVPFVMHSSQLAQDNNSNGLWTVTLTVSVFAEPADAWELVNTVYQGIWSWDNPTEGVVPGVGGIQQLVQELSAFNRIGGEAQMENKVVIQYTGSWQFAVVNL